MELNKILKPECHISDINLESLKIDTIPSGWKSLDDYMFLKDKRSELIIVGGRPSMGKSAFMFQLAYNVAQHIPVHVFSLEMDKEQILTRLLAATLNTSITAIQRGLVPPEALAMARQKIVHSKYFIDDRAGLDVHDLCIAAKQAFHRNDTKLIVVDYLQLMRTQKSHTKDDEIGIITKELKALAKDLKVPIIVGSQLNRANEIRGVQSGDYRPMLSDLRESGNIEQDADIVAFVHRESRYTGERRGEADIIIAKNRNGSVGTVNMGFVESQCNFIDRGDVL